LDEDAARLGFIMVSAVAAGHGTRPHMLTQIQSSSTASVSAATPTQHPFQRRIDGIKPSKA